MDLEPIGVDFGHFPVHFDPEPSGIASEIPNMLIINTSDMATLKQGAGLKLSSDLSYPNFDRDINCGVLGTQFIGFSMVRDLLFVQFATEFIIICTAYALHTVRN